VAETPALRSRLRLSFNEALTGRGKNDSDRAPTPRPIMNEVIIGSLMPRIAASRTFRFAPSSKTLFTADKREANKRQVGGSILDAVRIECDITIQADQKLGKNPDERLV
jgi:hypothetical protein